MEDFGGRHDWAFKFKHNDLFRPGDNFDLNACVGQNGGPYNFKDYSKGYFEAGKRLVRSIEDNHSLVDIIIYPIVYIHRHAIELGLKHLAYWLPPIFGNEDTLPLTHKLIDNWAIVRKYLEQLPEDGSEQLLIEMVENILKDLIRLDPKGEAFRFPQNKDKELYLQDTSIINVEIFAKAMDQVYAAFEFWFFQVETLWEFRAEADSYRQKEIESITIEEFIFS